MYRHGRRLMRSSRAANKCSNQVIVVNRRTRLLLIVMLCLMTAGLAQAQSSAGAQAAVVDTPQVVDDRITLRFTVRDRAGFTPADLSVSSVSLSENADDVTISSADTQALRLAVIINLSNGSDVDLIRDTLSAYFNTYYEADDVVTFYVLGPQVGQPEISRGDALSSINTLIDGLKLSPNVYSIRATLRTALDDLLEAGDELPRQTLYVGSFLNNPDEVSASTIFAQNSIPFNVVLVQRFRPNAVAEHRTLASFGGGAFANNAEGSAVALQPSPAPLGPLKILYDTLVSSRKVYSLSYRSTTPTLDAEPTVTLSVTLPDGETASTSFRYARIFQLPEVEILNTTLAAVRQPSYSGERIIFDAVEIPITVAIRFPDGVQRGVQSIRLDVVETASDNVVQSRLFNAPAPDGNGNYSIPWTFDNFITPGTITPLTLVVSVTDEINLSASTQQNTQITVGSLPPLPTPTLLPTPAAATSGIATNVADNLIVSFLAALALALILAVVFLLVMVARLRSRPTVVEMPVPAYVPPVEMPAPTPVTPAAPVEEAQAPEEALFLGRLVTVNGLEASEIRINKEEFVIGRDASCDYVIDKPFVSPRHCTIMLRKSTFFIRDLGAKNGTYVNGERLPRNRDIPVPIGSELGITLNIILELWDPKTVVKIGERKTSATHHSTVTRTATESDDLVLKTVFGIKNVSDDAGPVDDDYSPV